MSKRLLPILCLFATLMTVAQTQIIDPFSYASDDDARAAWKMMGVGQPVTMLPSPIGGRTGMKLPCDLTGDKSRAAWDKKVTLDLTRADRIAFWFYVDDPTKVSGSFSLYFESGAGWYHGMFPANKGWNRVVLNKSQFGTEGTPQGWKNLTTIRLSVWKQKEAVTFCAIDDLRALSSDVAVVLGDRTPKTSAEWGTVTSTAQAMSKMLADIGIEAGVIADTDVEQGALEGRKVVIFPHNPNMTESELDAVKKYTDAGGKVLAFFGVPTRLMEILGIRYKAYKPQETAGQFSTIRFTPGIPGLPKQVSQASWNINVVAPSAANARVLGEWYDSKGNKTGYPAITISDTGIYMTHILLSDDQAGKQRMMMALLGHCLPELWVRSAKQSLASAEVVGEFRTLDALKAFVDKSNRPTATKLLADATALLSGAKNLALAKSYPEAVAKAQEAKQAMIEAYCSAQVSKPGEMRAVWCHSASGVQGATWDEAVKALADNGFNMVMPNMLWAGRAFYNSSVLPVDESVAKQGDRIAQCVEAGKKYGVQVHVWKVNWNLMNAPADFLAKMRAAGRTQKTPQGADIDYLCPSSPDNFALERDSMLEVVRNYDVDGIHFDYIRYPDSNGCYCAGCRERFEKQLGLKVEKWPEDVVSGSLRQKYLAFRRSNITRLVKAVSEQARAIKPKIKISAAVFSSWPMCRDDVGQDWGAWVQEGYLDFVCPMNYTDSPDLYDRLISGQIEAIKHAKPFVSGLGVTLGDWTLTPDQVARQVNIARKNGCDGFILFNYDAYVMKEVLKRLRTGSTEKK